ncbi:hypothetical protein [Ulvibacterium sp.]|uniref:hypothetical protein n=1 Tax=Ulvibacterium sp. TaxID=2665914 RepID=UPI003BA9B971
MRFWDKESAIPFDQLIYEMYAHRSNKEMLLDIQGIITANKQDYCSVHYYTLINAVKGYLGNLE